MVPLWPHGAKLFSTMNEVVFDITGLTDQAWPSKQAGYTIDHVPLSSGVYREHLDEKRCTRWLGRVSGAHHADRVFERNLLVVARPPSDSAPLLVAGAIAPFS